MGHEPFFISADLPSWLNPLLRVSRALTGRPDPSFGFVQLRLLRKRYRPTQGDGPSRKWVQMGTDFGQPLPGDFVTFEDMTVRQLLPLVQVVSPGFSMHPRFVEARVRQQEACYRKAVACCVASHWAAEGVEAYGIEREKIHVTGLGCNHQVDVPRRDWSTPRFLFIGMAWARKNGEGVVEAFERLREVVPEAQLSLVGDHPEVDRPGVTGYGPLRLDVASERAEVERLLRLSTCLVVPSLYEPFGMVYPEAGWAGLPSIGTVVGGCADAIGGGGVVVDPQDSSQLLAAMSALCNPQLAMSLGEAARARAELLTWRLVARRVMGALGVLDQAESDLPPGHPLPLESL